MDVLLASIIIADISNHRRDEWFLKGALLSYSVEETPKHYSRLTRHRKY